MRAVATISAVAVVLSGCNYFGAKLPANDVDAAKLCWPVTSANQVKAGGFTLAGLGEIVSYATVVAKAEPGPGLITDKVGKVMNDPISDADKGKMRANLTSFQTQCRERFPVAAGKSAPTLPSDPTDRALWCLMAGVFLDKAMEGAGKPNYPEKTRVTGVIRTATAGVSDAAVAAKGITTEDALNTYRNQQADAMMGNRLDGIVAACPAG